MDILYLLIPLSAVLVLGIVAVFGWAVYSGQFDDLEREGQQLLAGSEPEALDGGQGLSASPREQSQPRDLRDSDGGCTVADPAREVRES